MKMSLENTRLKSIAHQTTRFIAAAALTPALLFSAASQALVVTQDITAHGPGYLGASTIGDTMQIEFNFGIGTPSGPLANPSNALATDYHFGPVSSGLMSSQTCNLNTGGCSDDPGAPAVINQIVTLFDDSPDGDYYSFSQVTDLSGIGPDLLLITSLVLLDDTGTLLSDENFFEKNDLSGLTEYWIQGTVFNTALGTGQLAFTTQVPVPPGILLFASALGGLGFMRRSANS